MIIFSRKKNNAGKKAFAMVFAVLSGSIMATIALIMVNLVEKEIRLASFAEKSRIAFFAADAGVECTLFLDIQHNMFLLSLPLYPTGTDLSSIVRCQEESQPIIVASDDITGGVRTTVFHTPLKRTRVTTAESIVLEGCAVVQVVKRVDRTEIRSFGQNRAWSGVGGAQRCISVKDGVERAIETTYMH